MLMAKLVRSCWSNILNRTLFLKMLAQTLRFQGCCYSKMEDKNSFPGVGQEEVVGGGGMCLGLLFNISFYLYFLMFNSAQPEWIPFHLSM